MATGISPNECGVCNEDYNERERCPRILGCSHTLCTDCVNRIFQTGNLNCPFCREKFRGECTNDIKVNHTALDFVKFFAMQDRRKQVRTLKDAGPGSSNMREIKENLLELTNSNIGLCQEFQKRTEKTLSELSKTQNEITDETNVLENEILSKVCGIIAQNNKTLERLKQTSCKLQKQTQDMKMKELQLRSIKSQLEGKEGSGSDDLTEGLDDAQVTNSFFEKWVAAFTDTNTEAKNSLKESRQELQQVNEKTKSMLRILNSAYTNDVETARVSEGDVLPIQEDIYMAQITIENLRPMTDPVKRLVKEGKVYAVHTRLTEEKERLKTYARISITEDNKLCLHALTEDPLPPSVHLLKHADVMNLVNPSSQFTFIQIEDVAREIILGNVYICLNPDSTRSKHFLILCTGVHGPSYSNSKFLRLSDKGSATEAVRFGDYESNIGSGGVYLLPWEGVLDGKGLSGLSGVVRGIGNSQKTYAQFEILTNNRPQSTVNFSFGWVHEGLQILTEAISNRSNPLDIPNVGHGSIQDLIIRDCGVVLAQNI